MKKLNNKGMSLVELIVSFAIVTVAVVYFSQSLVTVTKIYRNAEQETNELVKETYHLRLLDSYYKYALENSDFLGLQISGVYDDAALSTKNSWYVFEYSDPVPYFDSKFFTVDSYYNPSQKLVKIECTIDSIVYRYYAYFDFTKTDSRSFSGSYVFFNL